MLKDSIKYAEKKSQYYRDQLSEAHELVKEFYRMEAIRWQQHADNLKAKR